MLPKIQYKGGFTTSSTHTVRNNVSLIPINHKKFNFNPLQYNFLKNTIFSNIYQQLNSETRVKRSTFSPYIKKKDGKPKKHFKNHKFHDSFQNKPNMTPNTKRKKYK